MAIGLRHLALGELNDAQYAAAQGRNIAAQIGAGFALIYGGWLLGEIARLRGDYEQAINQHERALQFARPLEQVMAFITVQPMASLASTYVEIGGEYAARGSALLADALKLLDSPSGLSGGGTAWADIGFAALALGNTERASSVFQKGLQTPTMFQLFMRPRHQLGLALVALAQEHFAEAAQGIRDARTYAEARGMKYLYPQIALAEAQLAAAQGDHNGALAAYARADSTAQEMQMRPAMVEARRAAARSLAALHRTAESNERWTAAQSVVDDIAAHIDDEALRAAYLTLHRQLTDEAH
jgi:hypothetical protein